MHNYLHNLLQQRQQDNLYRTRLLHHSPQNPILLIDERLYLTFCSNDYLGLANHPQLKKILQRSAETYGIGSGASHLVTGHTLAHQQLEHTLAEFTGRERALLFSTGYMANIGVITALLDRHDAIFLDKLNHASLVDAALLSRAQVYRYADMTTLERLLTQSSEKHKLIVTDGVFSMDGHLADLPSIVQLAKRYDAWVMVDDAHGLGVLGKQGKGCLEYYGLSEEDVPILMGTLGKAYGTFGAFVAGSHLLIEVLIQKARSYIYTTALPPVLAEAAMVSVKLAQQESWRREYLFELIAYFRQQAAHLPISSSHTPIQPLILGNAEKALTASEALYQQGIIVTAIRPPTVPKGTSRLRITLTSAHKKEHIIQLVEVLTRCLE